MIQDQIPQTQPHPGLRQPQAAGLAALPVVERRRELTRLVAAHAAAVLGTAAERIAPQAPLLALGLDSLAAAELADTLHQALGVSLPFADLLAGASAEELAGRLAGALAAVPGGDEAGAAAGGAERPQAAPAPAAAARDAAQSAPATPGQQAIYYLDRLAPRAAAYNLAGAVRLPAGCDLAALRSALQAIVDRHGALRTALLAAGAGVVQQVAAHGELAWAAQDAAGFGAGELERRLHAAAAEPFDLERGPLFRAALFTQPQGAVLLLAVHHAVADLGSLAVVARELGILYRGLTGGDPAAAALPPAPQFAEHARRQETFLASPRAEELFGHWQQRLAGLPDLDLPTDRPRPAAASLRGAVRRRHLGAGTADAVRRLARAQGVTPFTVLLAAFQALLARYSGQTDFAVGSPAAGRSADAGAGTDGAGGGLARAVGYFVNPLPLRADLAGDPPAAALLDRTRTAALAAFAHQALPSALLAARLRPQRDGSRPPLFQVMLTLQQAPASDLAGLAALALGEPGERLDLCGLELQSVRLDPPGAPLELTLMVGETRGGLAAALQFATDLFDGATAERLLGHFETLLGGLAARPASRVSALPLLGTGEHAQIAGWNATAVDWPLAPGLAARIREHGRRSPAAVAVEAEDRTWTYGELCARATAWAQALAARGAGEDSLVGIFAERSPELVAAILAVLMAGGAYVPFDPGEPAERLRWMLADSGVRWVLTQSHLRPRLLESAGGAELLDLDGEPPAPAGPPAAAGAVVGAAGAALPAGAGGKAGPAAEGELTGLAYMIYTSGSTGRPKGAANTRQGLLNRLLWMQQAFPLTARDGVLHKTPIGFDVSVWELLWPLMVGARLVLARPGGQRDPAYLAARIARAAVTTVHFVPSLLGELLEQPALDRCTALRRVIASGEALGGPLARRFAERLGAAGVELHNLYGPTEAAIDVTWWPAEGESGERPVPIGRPIANTRIHLCDALGAEVPVGVPAELAIGGIALARGYWRRPDLTAERFVPDGLSGEAGARLYRTGDLARRLPGGEIEFLRRLDHQVKVRGQRIELGEVEAGLAGCDGVREAVAGLRGQGADARLVAWVVPQDAALDAAELRAALRRRLPEAMVPSAFVPLAALPRTTSGKIDRRALPEPDDAARGAATPYVAPRTPLEEALAGLWQELLGIDRVGVDDHFFDLGGHSLLATRLMARVRQDLGVNVPLAALFEETPTVAGLARSVARHQVSQADEDDLASALLELDGLSEDEVRALLEAEEG